MRWWNWKVARAALAAVCVFVLLASCGTVKYYAQAVAGQAEILRKSKPIPKVLADPKTKPSLKKRLEAVQDMRSFAKEALHLPADEAYHHYADLGREYVVWVVYAAPEFDVEAKSWWYPVVGSLKYRGFFDAASAKKLGLKLKSEGYDVVVGGVEAYSTLGWFEDPVLNTFLHRNDAELAELIFHELTHIRVFFSGDTEFNEALATAVGREGVRRWLKARGRRGDLADYESDVAKDDEIIKMLISRRPRLQKLYESNRSKSTEQQREAKKRAMADIDAEYRRIRARWAGDSRYDKLFKEPMNNARLCTLATYFDLVPAFEKLLRECNGDIEAFFSRLETFRPLSRKERLRALGVNPADFLPDHP
jgi:predicted aminopeptidase